MSNIITIGYTTEGATDVRFLQNIIQRTFEEVSFECRGEIEVWEPQYLPTHKEAFAQEIALAAQSAKKMGLMVLCVHTDADADTDQNAFENRINPALNEIELCGNNCCQHIIPIVPVQMTEAWMLADIQTLKEEIETTKSDRDLGLTRAPERIAQPKDVLKNALREAFSAMPRRRKRPLELVDLYQPLGQKIDLNLLEKLESYQKFKTAVRTAFQALSYL